MSFQFPVPDVLGGITVLRDQPYFGQTGTPARNWTCTYRSMQTIPCR